MNQRQLAREKLLFRYTSALERGDFATVEAILNEARHDAELARMLYEINTALGSTLPAVNLHRYNHKDSAMQHNPTLKLTPVRERSLPTRFPYALAAAILAVMLVGGLLLTAKFGLDNQDNFGGASLQQASATVTASVTPSPLNPIVLTGTPTLFTNDANPLDLTATAIPQNFPYYNAQAVLCTAVVTVGSSANQPNPAITLGTRPGNTWTFAGSIPDGTLVDILDQTYFPGGTGVWRLGPLMWYFVSSTDTPFPIQGWLQEFFVEFTSACPPLPDYETDYWLSGIEIRPNATAIQGSLPATLPPQEATAAAATEQAYYGDMSTASVPIQNDTDGDGLTYTDEVALGTNPNAWDTDGDDVGDGSEIRSGTDPLNMDTDMDGVIDSQDAFPTVANHPEATVAAVSTQISVYATAQAATPTPSVTPSPIFTATPTVCNPANPSRLRKGDQGRVIGEGRTGVSLRQTYGFDAPLIRLLDINTAFEVVDLNAICVEGTNWYKIAIDGEDAGWIPETMWVINDGAASSVYVVEPLN